jgi:phage/plasmid-associated DNA primase
MATNELPEVDGASDAMWRRLIYVPFEERITDAEREESACPSGSHHSRCRARVGTATRYPVLLRVPS